MYLYFIHSGTLFLRSSYHYLLKNIAPVMSICNFDQCCICVSVYLYLCICVFVFVYLKVRHPGTLFFRSSHHFLLKNIAPVMSIYNFGQGCICVFVFVYLQVRHQGTLFLRSSYHYLFKNIAHVMSICNFDQCCICVFVYFCICICVFASQTPRNIVFEVLLPLPFQKYSTCYVYLQL